jgi:hypothetical protein
LTPLTLDHLEFVGSQVQNRFQYNC